MFSLDKIMQKFADVKDCALWVGQVKNLVAAQSMGLEKGVATLVLESLDTALTKARSAKVIEGLWGLRAAVLQELGRYSEAVQACDTFLSTAEKSPRGCLVGIADINQTKAFCLAAGFRIQVPPTSEIHRRLGALEDFAKAEIDKPYQTPATLAATIGCVAMAHYFAGDDDAADRWLLAAVEINPDQAQVEASFKLAAASADFEDWRQFAAGFKDRNLSEQKAMPTKRQRPR